MRQIRRAGWALVALALLCAGVAGRSGPAHAATNSFYFPQTHHTVSGVFWAYWQAHGGVAQQGYPITEEFQENSPVDGQPYTVQYFERAVFELHPENAPPNNVLLSPLGRQALAQRYPAGAPPNQQPNPDHGVPFPQTGHTLGGGFAAYWQQHGGLAQYGYPLTDEFTETSAVNGKPYIVQYFERAVFEYHPEAPAGFRVMLSLLGSLAYHDRYEAVEHPRAAQWPPAPGLPPATHPVLFNATFATPDLSAWHALGLPDEAPMWRTLNAHLQQNGDYTGEGSPDETVLIAGDPSWGNILLEAQYFITTGDPVGVIWRVDGTRYYRLVLQPNLPNTVSKAALQAVDGTHVVTLAKTAANQFPGYTYGRWQTIQVLSQGAHQQVSVDGVMILDAQDSTLAHGAIGLYAIQDQATAFDNVRVQQLP